MFIDQIKENSFRLKNKAAYICGDQSLTYSALWEKASSLACYLRENGKSPVTIYGHKSPYMIISFLACMLSGRAYVPCDISTPLSRIEYIISQAKSELMIATETLESSSIKALSIEELREICSSKNECNTNSNKKHSGRQSCNSRTKWLSRLCRHVSNWNKYEISENENNVAYIIFTSGSTGTPKGVPISMRNLDHFIGWVTKIPDISMLHDGTVFNQSAFSFDLSTADIYIALVGGHTLFAATRHEQQDLSLLFQRLRQSRSTLIVCTPTFMQMCLCDSAFNKDLLPYLQVVFFCGEVLPTKTAGKLLERFSGIKIINAYGPTEATCAVCAVNITESMLSSTTLPVGKISDAAVSIMVVDGEKELPDGKCGEIMLHGESVSNGYIGGQSPSLKGDGYYYTGDIGKIENGYLYYLGRKDGQIKYKGYRIEPMEIEHCISEIEGIARAVVIPVEGNNKKILMLAAFAEKTNENITAEFVKIELLKKLPVYMIPKTIVFVDKLPMNVNGKCDRNALKESLFDGRNG